MAQLRMQHRRGGKTGAASLLKVFALFLVLFLLLFLGIYWIKTMPLKPVAWMPAPADQRFFLPAHDSTVKVVHNLYYSLGYSSGDPIPIWAACEWDARMEAGMPTFFDSNYFHLDSALTSVWREWGRKGEEAALRLGRLFVLAGPMDLPADSAAVNPAFFLVWLDEGYEKLEALGLLFPQDPPFQPVVVPVDSVESLSGLDLFSDYWLDSLENQVEKTVNISHWAPEVPRNLYFVPEK